jgi:hypothetical protein
LVANAGQRLALQVRLEVEPPHEPFTRRLLKPFFLGLLVAGLYRLLLAGPADLFARLLAAPAGSAPESLAGWLQSPVFGSGPGPRLEFVRHFVLATWWVGAVAGAVLLWQRGSRWADVLCGALAGAGAGFAGAATVACLVDLGDSLPRLVLRDLAARLPFGADVPPWLWTTVWLTVAVVTWGLAGGVAGFLLQFGGRAGGRLLAAAARPLAWVFQVCGLKGLAGLLAA